MALVSILGSAAWAQSSNEEMITRPNGVGMHIGATTGMGVSYRYWPGKVGAQINVFTNMNSDGRTTRIGGLLMREFIDRERLTVFGYIGGVMNSDTRANDFGQPEQNRSVSIGFGPGLDIPLGKIFSISLMGGYGIYSLGDMPRTNFTGEATLLYNF